MGMRMYDVIEQVEYVAERLTSFERSYRVNTKNLGETNAAKLFKVSMKKLTSELEDAGADELAQYLEERVFGDNAPKMPSRTKVKIARVIIATDGVVSATLETKIPDDWDWMDDRESTIVKAVLENPEKVKHYTRGEMLAEATRFAEGDVEDYIDEHFMFIESWGYYVGHVWAVEESAVWR